MAKGKYITEDKFLKIKALLNGGAKSKQIQIWEDVSEETVRRANKAETYEDYKTYSAFNHMKKEERIPIERLAFGQDDDCENTKILREIAFLLHIIVDKQLTDIIYCMKGERT